MTIYSGYTSIPHQTYDEWKNATLNNGYQINGATDLLYYYYISEFWYNVGFGQGYPYTGGGYGTTRIWENRETNASHNGTDYFDIITSINNVKKGDIVLYSFTYASPNGHAGFADADYSSGNLNILSQDNGGTPYEHGGSLVNVNSYDSSLFLGAFRYKYWNGVVPPIPPYNRNNNFKWALYARKLRDKRRSM